MTTGFLEEEPGVRSMTRLIAASMTALCALLVATICAAALLKPEHAAGLIAALTAPLLSLAAGIWAALKVRA